MVLNYNYPIPSHLAVSWVGEVSFPSLLFQDNVKDMVQEEGGVGRRRLLLTIISKSLKFAKISIRF